MKQVTLTTRRPASRHPWRLLVLTSLLVICVIPIVMLFRLDGPAAQQGQQRAAPLMDALERYRHDEGRYPARLELLVPTYLPTVPRAAWRYPYTYIVCSNGAAYILGFRPGGHSDLTPKSWNYSSEHGAWKFGSGGVPPYYGEISCLPRF